MMRCYVEKWSPDMTDTRSFSEPEADWSFELNYLRFFQFKADRIASNIDLRGSFMDEIKFFRNEIAEIRNDAGDDGLNNVDRSAIHDYRNTIHGDLIEIMKLPDLETMTDRLNHLNDKIEHYADLWGIDSW